ncbi:MAG: hypothetical protein HY313_08850 [Acidobacteria bacterium]|nr:hypothetical protein [Acidobacteriota bacterium]
MPSTTIATVIKMMESLPEDAQQQVAERLREYIADFQDERQWDRLFQRTQPQLVDRARQARRQIAQGEAKPLDYDRL